MAELLACQRDVARALDDEAESHLAMPWLAGDSEIVHRRLAIYRANIEAAAVKALAAAYPVTQQVIGGARFADLAQAYRQHAPSRSGDLNEFGASLPAFMADFQATRSLPYLPDLTRVEWAAHVAYGAADPVALDVDAMARLPVHRQSTMRFRWADGTSVIASPFAIVRIWRIHQTDFDGEFGVDWSISECALVAREGLRVEVRAIGAGDAAFIGGSLGGAPFATAAERALTVEPGLDLAGLLKRLIAARAICGFDDDKEE